MLYPGHVERSGNVQISCLESRYQCMPPGSHLSCRHSSDSLSQRPYLMHIVLALVHNHQRKLLGSPTSSAIKEGKQYSAALASYNLRLSHPVSQMDADALLATSTLINAYAFATGTTTDPLQCWPIALSSSDLQWLSVQKGPGLIMAATAQWLNQSVFLSAFPDFSTPESARPSDVSTDTPSHLLPALYSLCGAAPGSSAKGNVYIRYLDIVAALLPLQPVMANMGQYLPFIASFEPDFLALLRERDPRALLILAWWYALICPFEQWWLAVRSRTECTAICMLLERLSLASFESLLEFPARRCGYNVRRGVR